MKASKKNTKKLETRQAKWGDIKGTPSGADSIVVNGNTYHRPGSQNGRKGVA